MANNQAHDTRGTSDNRLAQAVGLNVAARAAPTVPETPEGLLVQYDFAGGDTLSSPTVNNIGFSFSSFSRALSAAPNGDLGVEFAFTGRPDGSDDAWEEQGYSIGTGLFENYERWLLWTPDNFEHRHVLQLTLGADQNVSGWVAGDVVGIGDGTGSQGIFYYTDGVKVWLKYAQNPTYNSWSGTVTNITRSPAQPVSTTARLQMARNNKFSAQWEGDYSTNAMVVEYAVNAGNLVPEPSFFTCKATSAISPSSGSGDANNSGTTGNRGSATIVQSGIEPADLGKINEFVIRRKRSSSLAASDGICQIWKNGILVYEVLNFPLFSATNNVSTSGYILGYSNSGFTEQTTFYLTKFEMYGSTPPPGIVI